jgi:hypothetical protein
LYTIPNAPIVNPITILKTLSKFPIFCFITH